MGSAILCGRSGRNEVTHLCEQVDNFVVIPDMLSANLFWDSPAQDEDDSFVGVRIVRKDGSMPTSISDGVVVYEGASSTNQCTDSGLTLGRTYYYRIFAYDSNKNYQTSVRSASIVADTGADVGALPVGSAVSIDIDSKAEMFYVVCRSTPGTSLYTIYNTWLLMKNAYTQMRYGSSNSYESSSVHTYLNNTFYGLIDERVRSHICPMRLPYRAGSGTGKVVSANSDGLEANVFLLSATECGAGDSTYVPEDGIKLEYFNKTTSADSKRVVTANGTNAAWATRSPYCSSSSYISQFDTTGALGRVSYSSSVWIRPAFAVSYLKFCLNSAGAYYEVANPLSIVTGDDFPDYVKEEAIAVARKVNAVQTDDSITFIAASDAHQSEQDTYVVSGNTHAGMGMNAVRQLVPNLDFCCFLGDHTFSSENTTTEQGMRQFTTINEDLANGFGDIPQFRTPGECDGLRNSYTLNGGWLTSQEVYALIGKYNAGATYGSTTEGYCYRDFEEKKLRVFCLNTSENGENFDMIGTPQKLWLARSLRTVGLKDGWGVIVLSHYPLDFTDGKTTSGAANGVGTILRQYVDGGSVKLNGLTISFKNANKAKIYATFHGHTHNFKVAKLSDVQTSGNTEFNVLRVATPNMYYFHNNDFGSNEGADSNGIEYGETKTYEKTHDTADDTAFVVNVINPTEGKIHSFCYGAGYDREITIV